MGGQYLRHDDTNEGKSWNDISTGWVGADYKFSSGVALHGIFYYQKANLEENYWIGTEAPGGEFAWRLAFDIPQDILKFTSLYVERMQFSSGFFSFGNVFRNLIFSDPDLDSPSIPSSLFYNDTSVWKIGATQKWNEKFSSWAFLANIDGGDIGLRQLGVGVEYIYNPSTIFGLNYIRWDGLESVEDSKHSRVRFTTQVTF